MKKRLMIMSAAAVLAFVASLGVHKYMLSKQVKVSVQQNHSIEEKDLAMNQIENKKVEEFRMEEESKKIDEPKMPETTKSQEYVKKQNQKEKVQIKKSPAPLAPSPVKQPAPVPKPVPQQTRLIDRIKAAQASQQVILVQSNTFSTDRVLINTYEKTNSKWTEVLTNVSGFIGRAGFSTNRREGDYTSPVGVFHIPYLFGWGGNPGYTMPYKQSTNDDFWLSLPALASYNVWFHRDGGPDPSWTKDQYEVLGSDQKLYKYAAVMDFNMGTNKILGKGSGIFLHINPTTGRGTAGCTSMPEDKLVQTLRWLDPTKNPVIIQGPVSELNKM